MNRLVRTMSILSELLDRAAMMLASGFVLLMLLCILIQIIARYVFVEPPSWTEELARHAMIWAGFLGATVTCRRRLDPVLVNGARLSSPALRSLSRWVEALAIALFCIPILAATPEFLALNAQRTTDALMLPSALVVVIIPVCILIILFHAVTRLLAELGGTGKQKTGDA